MVLMPKNALKSLEADIERANTLASDYPREQDGAYLQMRLSCNLAARMFPCLVQWADTRLAGALGLVKVLVYMVYVDGKTKLCLQGRRASVRQFYGTIFPSLLQFQGGVTNLEQSKQMEMYLKKHGKGDETEENKLSEADIEREEECGICMELRDKILLPTCNHTMCMKCYKDWNTRARSCPFCRIDLRKVRPSDLWMYIDKKDAVDMALITRENINRLFMFTDKLPLNVPNPTPVPYDCSHSFLSSSI